MNDCLVVLIPRKNVGQRRGKRIKSQLVCQQEKVITPSDFATENTRISESTIKCIRITFRLGGTSGGLYSSSF